MKQSYFVFKGYQQFMRYLLLLFALCTVVSGVQAQFTAGNIAVFVSASSSVTSNTTGSIVELNISTPAQAGTSHAIPDGASVASGLRFSGSASSTAYLSNSNDGTLLSFTGAKSNNTAANVNTLLLRGVGTFNAAGTYNLATTYTGTTGQQARCATSLDNTTWYIGDQGGFYSNGTTSASPTGNYRGVKSFGGIVYAFSSTTSLPPVGIISAPTGGTFTGLTGLANGTSSRQDFYMISSGSNGSSYDVLYVLDATSATAGTILKYSLVSGSWVANGSYTTTFGGFGLAAQKQGSGAYLFVSSGTGATLANNVNRLTDAAGYNTTINITTGNNITLYTAATGTIVKGIAFAPSVSCTTPSLSATVTNATCAGGTNGAINLTTTGGSSPFTYLWSNGATTKDLSNVAGGNYSVTVTATGGCTTTGSYVVNQPMVLTASATTINAACANANGSVDLTITGGTAPYTYLWSNTATTEDLTNVAAGLYNATITDAGGCTTTFSATVGTVADNINPTITAPSALTIGTNSGCTAAGINLGTPVTADNCAVANVTNNAPAVFVLGATTVTWTVTDGSGNSATATQVVTVQDTLKPAIALLGSIIPAGLTGPSTTQSPYLTSLKPGVQFKSFLSVNDAVGGYKMAGIPDGMGAFDNGNGTFTLLVNHEIGNTLGIARAHGSKGSFVSKWIINKADLSVVSGADLMQNVNLYDTTSKTYTSYNAGNPSTKAVFGRFCSADLPALSAFYNTASGLGTTERIFMNGEETNDESRQLAHIITGANAGTSWELPALGKGAWENSVANPATGNKTVVAEFNDGTDGQVYVYVGTKTNTGTEIEKAGLTNGKPYGVKVTGFPAERTSSTVINTPPAPGTHFDLVDLGDVKNITGVSFNTTSNAAAVTKFSRPEDGAWDPSNPADLYFNTTDQLDQVADGIGTQVGRSRIWRLRFTDISQPELGGTIEAVIDGTEGALMLDNMTIDNRGHILAQEDVGNADHNGKIWQYDIATDSFFRIASHDTARFGNVIAGVIKPATAPFNKDEESSGILDVSDILGQGMFLTTVQAHYAPALNTAEVVEGGQLLALYNPYSLGNSTAPDTVKVSVPFGTTSTPVNLGTPATADNCSVASVTNNAPSGFPAGTTNVTWTVTDASGNTATTNQVVVVTVTGNVPPVVSVASPSNPAVFDAGSTITVQVNATDADGSITKTELFVNGALFMTDSIAPYTFSGSNVEPGVYNAYVKATDNSGAFTISDTVVITVNGCTGSGTITGEGYTNIPGSQVADLTSNPAYPNSPSITAALTTFEYINVADNYGGRVRGYFCAPVSGNYIFNISGDDQAGLWLSTDANPTNKVLIAYTELPTAFRQWNKYATQKSAIIPMVKGARYYIETLQKEAIGSDHLSVAVTFPGGLFEGPIKGSRLSPIVSSARTVSGAAAFATAMESRTIVGVGSLKVTATPNPATSYFTLRTSSSNATTLSVKVIDAQGRIVETKLNMAANGTIRIGDKLPAGIYFVEALQGTQKERLKLVKE